MLGSQSASVWFSTMRTTNRSHSVRRLGLVAGNVAGAAFALYLLLPNLRFFLQTGRPIGLVFVIQQVWVAVVFVARRAPRTVSRRAIDWIAAYAGWFTSFLVRPGGYHPWALRRRPAPALQRVHGGRYRLSDAEPVSQERGRRRDRYQLAARPHQRRGATSSEPRLRHVPRPRTLAPLPRTLVTQTPLARDGGVPEAPRRWHLWALGALAGSRSTERLWHVASASRRACPLPTLRRRRSHERSRHPRMTRRCSPILFRPSSFSLISLGSRNLTHSTTWIAPSSAAAAARSRPVYSAHS